MPGDDRRGTGTAAVPAACGSEARGPKPLDPRLNTYRPDLADARLRGAVAASRYVEGRAARVVVGRAPVRHTPEPDSARDTFFHYGEPVLVFETGGACAWCQSGIDGYVGYVALGDIEIGEPPAPSHHVATTGSYLYPAPDLRLPPSDFLPRHSAVVVAETGIFTRGAEYARLDRGGFLPAACLSREPPRSPDLIAAAELYLGCPYLWGGRSFLGIDCSGLVQNAFRDIGIGVLRDTDQQQQTIGGAVAIGDARDLRRGDLLYLPGHVLIDAGDGQVIHADGASMTVRRDPLAELMRARGLDLAGFTVRRHPAASAG